MRLLLAVVLGFALSGCYSTYGPEDKSPPAYVGPSVRLGTIASVVVGASTEEHRTERIRTSDVLSELAQSLKEQGLFEKVVYPVTEFTSATPDVVIAATVMSKDDANLGENVMRGALVGASMFLLTPVLPTRIELHLSLKLDAARPDGTVIGSYEYTGSYEYKTTKLWPEEKKWQAWWSESTKHLVSHAIAKMQGDAKAFTPTPASEGI